MARRSNERPRKTLHYEAPAEPFHQTVASIGWIDPELAQLANAPNIDLYTIDASFAALRNKAEVEYLNNLPTSFVPPPEADDRLRAAAGTMILSSPELRRLANDAGAKLIIEPAPAGGPSMHH